MRTDAHKYTSNPVFLKAAVVKTRNFGSFEVFSQNQALERASSPTVQASKAAFEMAGVGPEDIDVAQLQDTESGAEIMHMSENGFCEDGEQEKWLAEGYTEIDGKLPVNTDGGCIANGEPMGRQGCGRSMRSRCSCAARPAIRQVQNEPKVGYTHVYGRRDCRGDDPVAIGDLCMWRSRSERHLNGDIVNRRSVFLDPFKPCASLRRIA